MIFCHDDKVYKRVEIFLLFFHGRREGRSNKLRPINPDTSHVDIVIARTLEMFVQIVAEIDHIYYVSLCQTEHYFKMQMVKFWFVIITKKSQ